MNEQFQGYMHVQPPGMDPMENEETDPMDVQDMDEVDMDAQPMAGGNPPGGQGYYPHMMYQQQVQQVCSLIDSQCTTRSQRDQ